ncbi:YheC/YheD family protein [Bacillus pinisoli]|uniref:YheC/YheD family endospore coat-associated protein n=1 Tax=Bacillus pinisoli TaxID=2901866 RepID=UPI001FF39A44|nr:YheC/YheD family protein [Bacillus pinisoli]
MQVKMWIKELPEKEGTILSGKRLPYQFVGFGTKTMACQFEVDQRCEEDTLYISKDLLTRLSIPKNRTLHLFNNGETLQIGPVIGIFTAGFTESTLRPIGERSLFFAKLLTMEKPVGVCAYVFGAHLINWNEGTVNGYFYDEKEGWMMQEVPLPNVIYDRLPNRKTENHYAIKKIKQRLKDEYIIPWYNPGFFNKWDVFQLLRRDTSLSKYLPETILEPSMDDIRKMINRHKFIYIKPANGSLGLGIFQVISSEDGNAFYCRYKDGEENRLQKFYKIEKLIQYIFRDRSIKSYIVQQGIHLIRYENRPLDFRIHTNRDQQGAWQVTAIGAKVAGRGSVTTHLNNGGLVKTLDELFPDEKQREQLEEQFHQAVIALSEELSSTIEGYIGEIGFDIGLDREGKLWLFEANSKPGRAIFSHPKLRTQDKYTRQLSMSYAIYLTEQGIRHPEVQLQ